MRGAIRQTRERKPEGLPADQGGDSETSRTVRTSGHGRGLNEKVLREIRHELGNHFHKLYYWAEYVQEGGSDEIEAAADPLSNSIQNLEGFLNRAMQYLSPVLLEQVRMNLADVTRALSQLMQSALPESTWDVYLEASVADEEVSIDPGQFSRAMATVAGLLAQASGAAAVPCRLSVSVIPELRGYECKILVPGAGEPSILAILDTLDWANAQRTIETHGGTMSLCEREDGTNFVQLILPWIG